MYIRPLQLVRDVMTCGSMPENYSTVAMRSGKCYILGMNTQLNKLLDDGEVALALDIDIDTDGRFPDPANHYVGKFTCIIVYLSNMREYITYGIHDITTDTRDSIAAKRGKFVLCKDEKEMVQRALWLIEKARPTHVYGDDTEPALMALYARAQELGVTKRDYFDEMLKIYDSRYAAYCV